MMPRYARWVLGLVLGLLPALSPAATYYVGTSGSNSNSCATVASQGASDPTKRKLTLNGSTGGISCLARGDTLRIGQGNYNECLSDNGAVPGTTGIPTGFSWSQPTTLIADSGTTPFLSIDHTCWPGDPGNAAVMQFDTARDNYIIIDGLGIDANGINNGCIATTASRELIFQNFEIRESKHVCIAGGGAGGSGTIFRNLNVHTCGTNPVGEAGAHCYYLISAGPYVIEGGSVSYAHTYGIQLQSEGRAGVGIVRGVHLHHNPKQLVGTGQTIVNNLLTDFGNTGAQLYGPVVYNNTFYNTVAGVPSLQVYSGNATAVANNIFLSAASPIEMTGGGTYAGGPNLCPTTSTPGCSHSGTVAATWENAAGGDFRLKAGSPAIGIGTNLASLFTTDMTGTTRTVPWDVGACKAGVAACSWSGAAPPVVATYLAFGGAPSDGPVGTLLSPVDVRIMDASFTLIPTATNTVTLALGVNPSGGVLSGTLVRAAVAGVARFDDLSINAVGAGYTFLATSPGLATDQSAFLNITPVPAPGLAPYWRSSGFFWR